MARAELHPLHSPGSGSHTSSGAEGAERGPLTLSVPGHTECPGNEALQPPGGYPGPPPQTGPASPGSSGGANRRRQESAPRRGRQFQTQDTHHSRLVPDGLQAVLHGPAVRRRLHILTPHGRASGTFPQAQDGAGKSCKQNRHEHVAHSHKACLLRFPRTGPRHPAGTLGRPHQLSRRASHSQGAAWSPASWGGEGRPIWFTVSLCHYF